MDLQLAAPEFGPGPRLPDPALQFLEQIWTSFIPISDDSETSLDQATGQFVNAANAAAKLAKQTTDDRKAQFVKILEAWDKEHDAEIERTRKRKKGTLFKKSESLVSKVRADISKQHDWSGVLEELFTAREAYSNPKGAKVVHKWLRKAADNSSLLEPFLDFIPDFEYSSVICGGIKFVLKACTAAKRFRDEAFDLVNELPEKIDIDNEYSELYGSDAKVQLASNQLYLHILMTLEGIMLWLTKDHTFEWLKPLFLQKQYDPLKGKIEDVRKASAQMEAAVLLCDRKKLVEIGDGVNEIQRDMVNLKNLIVGFMRAQFQTAQWFANLQSYKDRAIKENQDSKPKAYISQAELLLLLDFDTTSEQDKSQTLASQTPAFEIVLRAGFAMDREEQIRAEWLMANKDISHWFRSARPRTRLINGNHNLDRITPLSFFCAMLVQSLKPIEPVIVLSHFCGLHTAGEDLAEEQPGSSGLIRSLLTQLLEQWRFGEFTCLSQAFADQLKNKSPGILPHDQRHVLWELITALPPATPLFIIIDGINFYEIDAFSAETKKMIKELNGLLSNSKVKSLIKILVTNTTRAFEVNKYFEFDEIIEMPQYIDRTRAGHVDAQFNLEFEPKIAELEK